MYEPHMKEEGKLFHIFKTVQLHKPMQGHVYTQNKSRPIACKAQILEETEQEDFLLNTFKVGCLHMEIIEEQKILQEMILMHLDN